MSLRALSTPWAPRARGYCLPGSVVLKMALGEAPPAIPAAVDVRMRRVAAAQGVDGGVIDRLLRHFAGGMRVARVHAAAASLGRPGARHLRFDDREQVFGLARTFRIDVPRTTPIADLVDALNQVASVEIATPNYVSVTPFDLGRPEPPVQELDWAPWRMVRADEALAFEPGDRAVTVGVVDSGVTLDHPELLGRLRSGFDTVQIGRGELSAGMELLGDRAGLDTNPTDGFVGHGMACAGIIGALGLTMAPGLAGEAQVLPMRALGAARFPGQQQAVGIGAATDLDMAVKMAVDLDARIINMSFGTDDAAVEPHMPKPHTDVMRYAHERGCVLVAASGNNGERTLYWPAAFPEVIAVGAVGADGRPTAFSTRGEHVALCAPGERIFTLGLEGYQRATGTSFAAPFVSAVAALLVARGYRRSMALSPEQVKALLVETAQPFGGGRGDGCGAGVLDAHAALQALDACIDRTLPDDSAQVDDG